MVDLERLYDIPGFDDYMINKKGDVYYKGGFGVRKKRPSGYISVTLAKNGYYIVHLNKKIYYVHRLLAETFIENPENKKEVDHIDGNPRNNNLDNLRWATHKENLNNSVSVERERLSHIGKESNIKGRKKVWIDKDNNIYKMI